MNRAYVIVAPTRVSTSAGVSALYKLNDDLVLRGYKSRVISISEEQIDISKVTNPPTDDEIVLYPDCFIGNPFKAKRVIRFLFMNAGYFGHDKTFPNSEFMYYFAPEFIIESRNAENILTVPTIREERFPYHPYGRSGTCYLATKLDYFQIPVPDELPKDYTKITKNTDLEVLFATKQKLITYDNSAINLEAMMCGMEVEFRFNNKFPGLITFGGLFDYSKPRQSYAALKSRYYTLQLPFFVERTQRHFA